MKLVNIPFYRVPDTVVTPPASIAYTWAPIEFTSTTNKSSVATAAPNLHDNNTSTGYTAQNGTTAFYLSAIIDLGAAASITRFTYNSATTGGGTDYLWGSNDGTNWTMLVTGTVAGSVDTTITAVSYRYFALSVSGGGGPNVFFTLSEFHLYNGTTLVSL